MTLVKPLLGALIGAALLAGCGPSGPKKPPELAFSILSAEDQQSMGSVWNPLIADLKAQTGLNIRPYYASNYTLLVEAMKANQTQIGWFSALPALEAVNRADGQVLGRVIGSNGEGETYESVLIVHKGSGITLDKVLACGKRYTFGIGDPKSTSGTLAPMAYLFAPKGIEPSDCFKTVRSANHQANLLAVANGVVDVATNNTVGLVFARRANPKLTESLDVIWTSQPLPESSIVVRKDLPEDTKAKLTSFFTTYGKAAGADGDRQRKILKALTYVGFAPTDDSYLDPVRMMEASSDLSEAKHSGDPRRIAVAQKAFDVVSGEVQARTHKPPA